MDAEPLPTIPPDVARALEEYAGFADARVSVLRGGLIHRTFAVDSAAGRHVLQRVSEVFSPRVHENIAAVTAHLAAAGLTTPTIVATRSGALCAELGAAGRWRMQRRLPGGTSETCVDAERARRAGALVARFHSALADFAEPLHPLGFVFHDTPAHLADLAAALERHAAHRLHGDVAALAREIFEDVERWPDLGALPARVIHGDLKFSNVLFDGGEATALIDLDTLARMPLSVDLGDAWRSWCNPRGEDVADAGLDLDIFRGSAEGYLGDLRIPLSAAERESLVVALERIALELAARFAADALEEKHWGWDPQRFPGCGEHNLLRARGQLSLHRQAFETRAERRRALAG